MAQTLKLLKQHKNRLAHDASNLADSTLRPWAATNGEMEQELQQELFNLKKMMAKSNISSTCGFSEIDYIPPEFAAIKDMMRDTSWHSGTTTNGYNRVQGESYVVPETDQQQELFNSDEINAMNENLTDSFDADEYIDFSRGIPDLVGMTNSNVSPIKILKSTSSSSSTRPIRRKKKKSIRGAVFMANPRISAYYDTKYSPSSSPSTISDSFSLPTNNNTTNMTNMMKGSISSPILNYESFLKDDYISQNNLTESKSSADMLLRTNSATDNNNNNQQVSQTSSELPSSTSASILSPASNIPVVDNLLLFSRPPSSSSSSPYLIGSSSPMTDRIGGTGFGVTSAITTTTNTTTNATTNNNNNSNNNNTTNSTTINNPLPVIKNTATANTTATTTATSKTRNNSQGAISTNKNNNNNNNNYSSSNNNFSNHGMTTSSSTLPLSSLVTESRFDSSRPQTATLGKISISNNQGTIVGVPTVTPSSTFLSSTSTSTMHIPSAKVQKLRSLYGKLSTKKSSVVIIPNHNSNNCKNSFNDAELVRNVNLARESQERNKMDHTWSLLQTKGFFEAVGPDKIYKSEMSLGHSISDKELAAILGERDQSYCLKKDELLMWHETALRANTKLFSSSGPEGGRNMKI